MKEGEDERELERVGKRRDRMRTYVVNELGKLRKYCLFVVSCSETTRVANRSSVSLFWWL